ncbi:hypothetical protein D3C78_1434470 [compost metagenome]
MAAAHVRGHLSRASPGCHGVRVHPDGRAAAQVHGRGDRRRPSVVRDRAPAALCRRGHLRRGVLYADELPDDGRSARDAPVRALTDIGQPGAAMACDCNVRAQLLQRQADHALWCRPGGDTGTGPDGRLRRRRTGRGGRDALLGHADPAGRGLEFRLPRSVRPGAGVPPTRREDARAVTQ